MCLKRHRPERVELRKVLGKKLKTVSNGSTGGSTNIQRQKTAIERLQNVAEKDFDAKRIFLR